MLLKNKNQYKNQPNENVFHMFPQLVSECYASLKKFV